MASLAKVFTGVMIQSLAKENRIDLEKTADTYIKELNNTPFGKATLQQLMDMQVSVEYPTHGYETSSVRKSRCTTIFSEQYFYPEVKTTTVR